jgi:hypothetical protein
MAKQRYTAEEIIVNNKNVALIDVFAMQSADILRLCAFPRNWERQKQSIEAGIVETLAKIAARGKHQSLRRFGTTQRSERSIAFPRRYAAAEHNDLTNERPEASRESFRYTWQLVCENQSTHRS